MLNSPENDLAKKIITMRNNPYYSRNGESIFINNLIEKMLVHLVNVKKYKPELARERLDKFKQDVYEIVKIRRNKHLKS